MSATIREAKARHEARLLAMPGVVSVGVGRGDDGRPVIVIGVDEPRPQTMAELPETLEGHPVRVEIVGRIRSQ